MWNNGPNHMFIYVRGGGFKKYQKILDLVAKSLEYIVQTKQKNT